MSIPTTINRILKKKTTTTKPFSKQVSLINFVASLCGAGGIQAFKTMRTLRALRPLRAMSRMQGMRVRKKHMKKKIENFQSF